MNYTKLSLAEVSAELSGVADDALRVFGALDERRLNWKPDEKQWSVAQCFDHLISANDLLVRQARSALAGPPASIWQKLPVWPAMFGRLMVSSQGPRTPSSKKYTADPQATPASRISSDIVQRFVDQQRELAAWTKTLDEHTAHRTILVSPFVNFITYSVLDGVRLIVAHDRRHFEQAQRVLQASPR